MKTSTKSTVLALLAGAMLMGAAPFAMAQDAAPRSERTGPAAERQAAPHRVQAERPHHRPAQRHQFRGGFSGGLAQFLHPQRGAEAIEVALVRLSHRVDLTEDQRALLDTLREDALAAHAAYAEAVGELRPQAPRGEDRQSRPERPAPDALFARVVSEQAARAQALQEVEPAFTAFFSSLSEEQLSQLRPQRPNIGTPPRPERPARPGAGETPAEG